MPKAFSPQDKFFHQAKKEGYRARSAFKLKEILQKYPQLIPYKGGNVMDLGAAPGSFLQVILEKNRNGKTCGVDLQAIDPFKNFSDDQLALIQGDVFSDSVADNIFDFFSGEKLDLLTSDLAPKTSGVKDVDQWKSIELNQRVLELAEKFLKKGGNLVAKIFRGSDFDEFWVEEFKPVFNTTKTFKPKSCRDRSVEVFLIGQGYKG